MGQATTNGTSSSWDVGPERARPPVDGVPRPDLSGQYGSGVKSSVPAWASPRDGAAKSG